MAFLAVFVCGGGNPTAATVSQSYPLRVSVAPAHRAVGFSAPLFSFHPYIRWVPSLGIVALHPPVTLHISPLGHGAGVQRHPRRCVYSSGAVPPRPDPIAMCSLKGPGYGSERARLRARAMHHSTNRSLLVERHQCISTLSDSKVSNYPGYRPRRWRLTHINKSDGRVGRWVLACNGGCGCFVLAG